MLPSPVSSGEGSIFFYICIILLYLDKCCLNMAKDELVFRISPDKVFSLGLWLSGQYI